MSVSKTIVEYLKKHKLKLLFICLSIVLVTLIALLPAQILKRIVDDVIPSHNKRKLLTIAIVYTATYVLVGLTTFIKDIIMLSTSQEITTNLRCNMMKHIEKINYKSLVSVESATFEAYFNNDVNSINELFTSGVVNMITDLFKMIGIVISIFIFSYKFGLIVLLVLPLLVVLTSIIRKKMLKAQLKTKSLESNVNKGLLENVENIEQIKINKSNEYATSKYNETLTNHYRANQASNFYDAIFSPLMQIIRNAVICTVLLVSGYNADIFGMTVGAIIAAISLLTDLFTPVENLGMEIQTIQKSVAAVKRINQFFLIEEDDEKTNVIIESTDISFKDVSFAYNEQDVIKDFNLDITNGDKIALQGPSGSGKSTLMKLALGIVKPTSGSVTIGGVDAYLLDNKTRRSLFAIVYQDPFFSGGTIYDEITLNDNSISHEAVIDSLKLVGLDYICDIDKILNKTEYSSGELALFNIARVVVRNPKIIFLDEMNAKIDPITGKNIIELINKIAKDKIVISINHYGDILENARVITLK